VILNRYERMVARRYLLPHKGEGFIFVVAGISLTAVMLGVAALIIVMSVMNGFRAELFDKVTGLNGHAVVQSFGGRLENWQPVLAQARQRHAGLAGRGGQLAQDGGGQLVEFGNGVVHRGPRAGACGSRARGGPEPAGAHAPANVVSACWVDPAASCGVSMTGIDLDVGVPAAIAVDDSGTSGFVSG